MLATFTPNDKTDYNTGTGSATWTIYGLDLSQSATSVNEGQSYALVMGSLNLASGTANGYSIAWGDGTFTTVNPGSPATSPANTTVYHTYTDAPADPVADISVSVLVNDVPVLVGGISVTVNDVPPTAVAFVQYPAAPVSEGTAAQVAFFGGTVPSPEDLPLHYAFDFNGATQFNTGAGTAPTWTAPIPRGSSPCPDRTWTRRALTPSPGGLSRSTEPTRITRRRSPLPMWRRS